MATLVLGIAGLIIGGPIGGMIGAFAGALIDNYLIYPAIFPKEDLVGPRLGDLQFQGAEDGSPSTLSFGPNCRAAGVVIWLSPLSEIQISEDVGKGGGQEVISYIYDIDMQVELCRNEITSLKKIWGMGKVIYNAGNVITKAGTNLSCTRYATRKYDYATQTVVDDEVFMDVESPSGGPDLSLFISGTNATSSGWTSTDNNGSFLVVRSLFDTATGKTYLRLKNDDATTEAAGASVTITETLAATGTAFVSIIDIALGTDTQVANSTIESYEGAGNVPGHRGTAYVVLRALSLEHWGNSVPQLSFLWEEAPTRTIADAITSLCLRAGLTAAQIDVSGVSGNISGYVVRGAPRTTQALQPILLAYDIVAHEDNGVVTFIHRKNMAQTVIDPNDLSAREPGDDLPRQLELQDDNGLALPSEVIVSYQDPQLDYQTRSVREARIAVESENIRRITCPMVLTFQEARILALRLLWSNRANRQKARWTLPPSYLAVLEAEFVEVVAYGETWKIFVAKMDRGANYVLSFEGMIEVLSTLQFATAPVEDPFFTSGTMTYPGVFILNIIDFAPLTDAQANVAGFYFTVSLADPDDVFIGGELHHSINGGVSWSKLTNLPLRGATGRVVGIVPTAAYGRVGHWDRGTTITIELDYGAPSSEAEIDVLNGKNHFLIGEELIAAATVTLTGTRAYELTDLIRGVLDTEAGISQHAANEKVIWLNSSGVNFRNINLTSMGQTRLYKAVPAGGSLAAVNSKSVILSSNTLRSFRVCHITGTRDGSNNLTAIWDKTTRLAYDPIGTAPFPDPDPTFFEADIKLGGSVVRTITINASANGSIVTVSPPSVLYKAADQTIDGITPGNPVTMEVFRWNTTYGRGKGREATV